MYIWRLWILKKKRILHCFGYLVHIFTTKLLCRIACAHPRSKNPRMNNPNNVLDVHLHFWCLLSSIYLLPNVFCRWVALIVDLEINTIIFTALLIPRTFIRGKCKSNKQFAICGFIVWVKIRSLSSHFDKAWLYQKQLHLFSLKVHR